MVASESVAMDALDFEVVRDILPGEAVIMESNGTLAQPAVRCPSELHALHLRVRLLRPAGLHHRQDLRVQVRLRMGERLADKILRERPDHDIDVVIPIPIRAAPAPSRWRTGSA